MNVTIADKLSPKTVEALNALGLKVATLDAKQALNLAEHLSQTDMLVVRSTKVSAAALAAAPQLSLVIRAGAGYNNIDVAAAGERGIYVCACPGKNAAAVAELAMGLLIAADRGIADACAALRAGQWKKSEFGKARGLKGRTLGILGLGQIGLAVARAAQALEMLVVAWSRSFTPQLARELNLGYAVSANEVAKISDAISLHLPLNAETKGIVGRNFFASMKPGAILVNTARAEIVDDAALRDALAAKRIKYAADVFPNEPAGGEAPFADTELASLLTGTPHIGASTDQSSEAIADEVVRIIASFVQTGHPPGAVNLCAHSPATHTLVVRHFNRVGVLASVLNELRSEGINVEEMQNTVFEGAHAACCTLRLDNPPSDDLLTRLRASGDILHVLLQASG